MSIRAITPSFRGNIRFTSEVKTYYDYTKKTIEIPAEKIVSYREINKRKTYPSDKPSQTTITTQITDAAGQKYNFDLPLENVKKSVEKAKETPNETVQIPEFLGME